jgi:tripartite motif-containing protein 71
MRRLVGIMLAVLGLCVMSGLVVTASAAAESYKYLTTWGSGGIGDGQFDGIGGIALDGSSYVYVSDKGNKRIEKFTASGTYVAQWATPDGAIDGVAVDGSGNVYAADFWNGRILKFSSSGALLAQFNTKLPSDFDSEPHSVAVDSSGNTWVVDSGDSLVKKFDAGGTYLGSLPKGPDPGQIARPIGVAVDSSSNVYVVDYLLYNVQKFSSSGTYLDGHTTIVANDPDVLYPTQVAVDGPGNVYVSDEFKSSLTADSSLKRFDPHFNLLARIGVYSPSPALTGTFCLIGGVTVAPSGTVYVADTTFDRVLEFGPAAPTASTTKLSGPASVKVNKTLKLTGTVSPATASGSVTITKTRKVGSKWKSAGTAKVTVTNGAFNYKFKPKSKGSWRFVATYAGGNGYASSKSATKTVKVK